MLQKEKIDQAVAYINDQIKQKFETRLESIYLVGSYPMGIISSTRPDVDWLLIWKEKIGGEDRWELGKILSKTINEFEHEFTVRPEFRPFKYSYPIKKTEYDLFVNLSNAYAAHDSATFKKLNPRIPDYVFAGFQSSRQLVFGTDLLKNIEFEVSVEDIIETGRHRLTTHKIQLDRIPLTYHLQKEIDLIYNEALSHGKNLMYFGVEMLMSDAELREKLFLDVLRNNDKILQFYKARLPEVVANVETVMTSKEKYPHWKYEKPKAKALYLAAHELVETFTKYFSRHYQG